MDLRWNRILPTLLLLAACSNDPGGGKDLGHSTDGGIPEDLSLADLSLADLSQSDAAKPMAVTLLGGLKNARALAADTAAFYWTAQDGVYRLARGGTSATLVQAKTFSPHAIAVDSGAAFWSEIDGTFTSSQVWTSSPIPAAIAAGLGQPLGLAYDASYVYWADGADRGIYRVSRSAGTADLLGTIPDTGVQTDPTSVAVDSTNVYVTLWARGEIVTVPKAGGPVSSVLTGENNPTHVIVVGSTLYFTCEGTSTDTGFLPDGTVRSVPIGGGFPMTLASSQMRPQSLVADATHIYWVNLGDANGSTGSVRRVPLAGGAVETLADNEVAPIDLVVDSTRVYWVNAEVSGTLRAVDK